MATQASARPAGTGAAEPCAHCGERSRHPVLGLLRGTVVVYCSAGCRDDHLVALALASSTCAAPGCDVDAAADVPYCDEHLDPAARPPTRGARAA